MVLIVDLYCINFNVWQLNKYFESQNKFMICSIKIFKIHQTKLREGLKTVVLILR